MPDPGNPDQNFVSVLRVADFASEVAAGALSLKCAYGGEETYILGSSHRTVREDNYLILNRSQEYSSSIDQEGSMESFCVWFRAGYAEEVTASLTKKPETLLDDPNSRSGDSIEFYERTYPRDTTVSPVIERIRRATNRDPGIRPKLDELFGDLMEAMLVIHRNTTAEVHSLSAIKASTREELYRRLHSARDYLETRLYTPVSLSELAAIAGLSMHYFLRQFQQLFGESPREYQARRRMERALSLVTQTTDPITQICLDVGYESLGSFSWEFRRRFGVSPAHYRRDFGRVRAKNTT